LSGQVAGGRYAGGGYTVETPVNQRRQLVFDALGRSNMASDMVSDVAVTWPSDMASDMAVTWPSDMAVTWSVTWQ